MAAGKVYPAYLLVGSIPTLYIAANFNGVYE